MAGFTVDTHLFRELGELLVGRDSTALIELIKNAYDADSTEVTVYGEALSDSEKGLIRITDDGNGMNRSEFEYGFLRIASRAKSTVDRRSRRFHRRYTGAKGIGRLAAHKLAHLLEVSSIPWANGDPNARRDGVEAIIDWDKVETYETLDDLNNSTAVVVRELATVGPHSGTTITLRGLRHRWTKAAHARFLEEVQTLQVPKALSEPLPSHVVAERLLFERPTVRDLTDSAAPGFQVKLLGELEPPDDYWQAALNAADWIIEIDADPTSKAVRYAISPTAGLRRTLPNSTTETYSIRHPDPEGGPFFQCRILVRTGQMRLRDAEKEWAGRANGIRVFWEGFRVLPYGEPRNDWLGLDRDAAERVRGILSRSDSEPFGGLVEQPDAEDPGLLHLPTKHYFGAVFLTERLAPALRLLINREGFVPDPAYETLVSLVRAGIDLATRVRAAATFERRQARKQRRSASRDKGPTRVPVAHLIRTTVDEAAQMMSEARVLATSGKTKEAAAKAKDAIKHLEQLASVSDELADESAMFRVLASVGTQLASFVHEMNGLLGMAQSLENGLAHLRRTAKLRPEQRRTLGEFARGLADLRRNLERQASYLIDVVSPDARRRRSRQVLADRLDAAARLVNYAAEHRGIVIQNAIPRGLRSPPMFPAELTAVFSNLLTNAVKAAGPAGRIRASGAKGKEGASVRIENTGVAVKPAEGERWFRPFESTTMAVDPVLGQGMGLGLPITRNILEEYGGSIRFVAPGDGFSTAIEITFPQ